MSTQEMKYMTISIPKALKTIGIIGGVWAILVIVGAAMVIIQPP